MNLRSDIFVVSVSEILSDSVISIAALGCLNIHPSRLPQYRGAFSLAHPIQDQRRSYAFPAIS